MRDDARTPRHTSPSRHTYLNYPPSRQTPQRKMKGQKQRASQAIDRYSVCCCQRTDTFIPNGGMANRKKRRTGVASEEYLPAKSTAINRTSRVNGTGSVWSASKTQSEPSCPSLEQEYPPHNGYLYTTSFDCKSHIASHRIASQQDKAMSARVSNHRRRTDRSSKHRSRGYGLDRVIRGSS